MAGLPIDIKDMLETFGDMDTARQKPVCVAIFLDASAPEDLLDFVKASFATTEANARVYVSYYEGPIPNLPHGCDLAVVVAAFSEHTGQLSAAIRAAGTPVLVLTSMPGIVQELAEAAGAPLLVKDLIAPTVAKNTAALPADTDFNKEPYPLDEAREANLHTAMGAWIVDVFADKRLAFAACFPFVRKPLAQDAVKATSMQNAAVGAVVIIPGADMPVMTANQAKMILQIAAAYGQKMGIERFKELAGVVAGAFALRTAARQVVGAIPVLGWAIKGGIGYAGTLAMGQAAISYFEATVSEGKSISAALDAARTEAERATSFVSRAAHALGDKWANKDK